MSLMSMRRKMASKQTATIILWALIVVFVASIFLLMPGRNTGDRDQQNLRYTGTDAREVVATINGDDITLGQLAEEYFKQLDAFRQERGMSSDLSTTLMLRRRAFETLTQGMVAEQAMKDMGVRVQKNSLRDVAQEYAVSELARMRSRAEMQAKSMEEAAKSAQEKGEEKVPEVRTADEIVNDEISQFLAMQGVQSQPTEAQFIRTFVDEYLLGANSPNRTIFEEHVRLRLLGGALARQLPQDPRTEEYAKKLATEEVQAHFIFIAASKPSPETLAEAEKKAKEFREQIVNAENPHAKFAELAKEHSAHPTRDAGGALGWLKGGDPQMMLPTVAEYLAFTLQPGEVSQVVQITQRNPMLPMAPNVGYGIIKVDGMREREDLAEDFDWDTAKVLDVTRTKQRYETSLSDEYMGYRLVTAEIVCHSPELEAYVAEGRALFTAADEHYAKALDDRRHLVNHPEVIAAISYKLATGTNDLQKRAELLESALPYASRDAADIHMQLGLAYAGIDEKDKAIQQFDYAHMAASFENVQLREILLDQYKKLEQEEKAAGIEKWLEEHRTDHAHGESHPDIDIEY